MSVGVVVPVHGWAPFLAETLDGILEQQPPPEQVLVVDDGSPEPLALAGPHAERCRLLRLPERRGLAGARAAGEAELATELLALCDADDTWESGSLAARRAVFERAPQTGVCFGSARIVGPDDRETGERWEQIAAGPLPDPARRLYEHNAIPVSSAIVRRDALAAAGGLESDLAQAEDLDLWLRLASRGTVFHSEPAAVVRYRRHPGGMTGDVAALAGALLSVHGRHAALVEPALRARVKAADRRALARGLVRRRDYAGARRELSRAAALEPPAARERMLALALVLPGARAALGRRDPYRR